MTEKSYVTLAEVMCPVCLDVRDTGDILLNTKLKTPRREEKIVSLSPCKECQEYMDHGFIALVEIDMSKSGPTVQDNTKLEMGTEQRTGRAAWIKKEALEQIVRDGIMPERPMMFLPQDTFQMLELMAAEVQGNG